jgi:hypothetical protein
MSAAPDVIDPGIIAGQESLLKLAVDGGTGVMIHNEATIEDVIRMAYNTPTSTYGYKLAADDAPVRLHPDILPAMRLPSRSHRI